VSTDRLVDVKSGKGGWFENHIRRLQFRDHNLGLATASRNDTYGDAAIVMESILNSCPGKILIRQRLVKMRMQRCQMVVRIGIIDFVDVEERPCPKSQQNSDNSEQTCGGTHTRYGSYTALPITAVFMTKTSETFPLRPANGWNKLRLFIVIKLPGRDPQ